MKKINKKIKFSYILAFVLISTAIFGTGIAYFVQPEIPFITKSSKYGVNLTNEDYTVLAFFNQPETRKLLYDVGIRNVRIFSSKWETWQNIETVYETTKNSGFKPILVTSDSIPVSERTIDIANRLKNYSGEKWYQIGNEPNYGGQYANPLDYIPPYKTVQQTISSIDPDAKFLSAGIGFWKIGTGPYDSNIDEVISIGKALKNSGAKIDSLAIHYYICDQEVFDDSTKEEILVRASWLKDAINQIKTEVGLPVSVTEWSWASWTSQTLHTQYVQDQQFLNEYFDVMANALDNTLFNCYWFAQLPDNNLYSPEATTVLLDNDGNPTGNYYAYKNIIK